MSGNYVKALKKHFGFSKFRAGQEEIVKSVVEGHHCFVIMPTGGGKSLCYQLPALVMPGTAIIISPLIALMKDQVDQLRGNYESDDIAHFLNSSLSKKQSAIVKADVSNGKTKLLYVAPETLTKEDTVDLLKSIEVSFVAIDEAHCISEWGHDFRPEYRRIREMVDALGDDIPINAFTATATPKVQGDIVKNLGMKDPQIFISSFNRTNLYYKILPKVDEDSCITTMAKLIKEREGESGIIYVLNRKSTEKIAETLSLNGIKAAPYHAGLDAKTRSSTQEAFLKDKIEVIVATIAFGMGIDKPDVRFVYHYNIPKSIENYYQETGRAGRDGKDSDCVAFYDEKDVNKLEKFLKDKSVTEREIGTQLLYEIVGYCETPVCRRKYLLKYFGEEFSIDHCDEMCDNCRHPKEQHESKQFVIDVLESVKILKENYPINFLNQFLRGEETQQMLEFGQEKLKHFGDWKGKSSIFADSVIRQCVLNGFLNKDVESYGVLKLNKKSRAFLKKPESVMMSLNRDFEAEAEKIRKKGSTPKGGALDNKLLTLLKNHRKDVAEKKDLPPYVIFQEVSLEDMATQYPISAEELSKVQGVSMGKARRYGKSFVDLIARYVEENDIQRPKDLRVKQVANKSANKVFFIEKIDRKIPLEDIADAKGLSMPEAIAELEAIVNSGTRIDLNYHINEMVDDELQIDVIDFFRSSENDSIDTAFEEFKEDGMTYEEIQLMRIKFISEMGN